MSNKKNDSIETFRVGLKLGEAILKAIDDFYKNGFIYDSIKVEKSGDSHYMITSNESTALSMFNLGLQASRFLE